MSSSLLLAYRAILRMHPAGFRAEFAGEMLWIFEEESRKGRALAVLGDGLRSLLVQHLRANPPQVEAAGAIYVEMDSSLPAERYAQTILTVMFCTLCFTLFTSMVVPAMAKPINRVIFRPIGFFAQDPLSQPKHLRSIRPLSPREGRAARR